MSNLPSVPQQRTLFGHPLGLYVLFFTEMWERFSYYGMRALLVLYMVKYYQLPQDYSSTVYKWYTSLVYLTPILGGFLADRYLGNKRAVLIGAVLMAIGHFLMAFEPYAAFYAALVFLILGNGMFKPNMSTQVGRLYPPNDPRRDGAYTIFYMGINLGAFLSPLVCGYLAENTRWKYHAGFTAAGLGMLAGLLIYLFGQHLIIEVPQDVPEIDPSPKPAGDPTVPATDLPLSEAEAERAPSVVPWLNRMAPTLLFALGAVLAVAGPVLALTKVLKWDSAVGMEIGAGCAFLAGWITLHVHNAIRDRVLAIYLMGIFVVCYWAAAEQAGNALNLWADQTTDRYLTAPAPEVPLPPAEQPKADAGGLTFLNPVPTAWFQSINALAIFVLAPLFAWLWVRLERKGYGTSIPAKIVLGVLLMSGSFVFMLLAAQREKGPSSVTLALDKTPPGLEEVDGKLRPRTPPGEEPEPFYQAGRLRHDPKGQALSTEGVLPDTERNRVVRDSAPASFKEIAAILENLTPKLKADRTTAEVKVGKLTIDPSVWLPDAAAVYDAKAGTLKVDASLPLKVHFVEVPPGFDIKLAGFDKNEASYDAGTRTLTVNEALSDKGTKGLLLAAGEPTFRTAVFQLYAASAQYRVSAWWLFWFYILATVGELYLSPVGLSMVSKLAPARYATMLMGLWLLTSFFGNFLAGIAGEQYEKFTPTTFFSFLLVALLVAALVGFCVVRKVTTMMHGVK